MNNSYGTVPATSAPGAPAATRTWCHGRSARRHLLLDRHDRPRLGRRL